MSLLVAQRGGIDPAGRPIATWPRAARLAAMEGAPAVRLESRAVVVITALPAQVNLLLYAGDTFRLSIGVKDANGDPFDLSGAVAESQIRATTDSQTIAGQFQPTISGNVIWLYLDAAVSANLPRACVWDCQIDRSGEINTLTAGTITMTPEVTR